MVVSPVEEQFVKHKQPVWHQQPVESQLTANNVSTTNATTATHFNVACPLVIVQYYLFNHLIFALYMSIRLHSFLLSLSIVYFIEESIYAWGRDY